MESLHPKSDFEKIFYQYKDRIYSYSMAILKSPDAAEEVTQEVMIKLWLNRDMLEQIKNLDGYIYVVARNKALNHLRKAVYDIQVLNELKRFLPQAYNNTEERVAVRDYEQLLQDAVNTLSPQRKQVYQLSRIDGLNHDEIAELLQLSKKTVKNHLTEAMKLIRQYLLKSGGILPVLTIYMIS